MYSLKFFRGAFYDPKNRRISQTAYEIKACLDDGRALTIGHIQRMPAVGPVRDTTWEFERADNWLAGDLAIVYCADTFAELKADIIPDIEAAIAAKGGADAVSRRRDAVDTIWDGLKLHQLRAYHLPDAGWNDACAGAYIGFVEYEAGQLVLSRQIYEGDPESKVIVHRIPLPAATDGETFVTKEIIDAVVAGFAPVPAAA